MALSRMQAFWRTERDRQRAWIDEHGRTIAGYVARYGSETDATHYGSGGEQIYVADVARLRYIESRIR